MTDLDLDAPDLDLEFNSLTLDLSLGAIPGPKGEKGDAGEIGPIGPQGPQGPQGIPGPAGAQGAVGAQGEPGLAGPQGVAGHSPTVEFGAGADADRLVIDAVASGPHLTGPQGAKGDAGPSGPQGAPGPTGPQGAAGIAGQKGDAGDVGPQGIQGPQGPAGSVGPQGAKGDTGQQGTQGPAGPGLPSGGAPGQVPAKLSGSDYDIGWITPVGGSGYSDEQAQDAVGSILLDSATIDFTYDDAANSMTAAVKFQQSIAADASGLKLAGDSAAPGALKLYGTDAAGAKGWYAQLSGGAGGSFAFVDVI